ncbi:hypothetical protein AU468_10920 [Alkalispirochaeta sphaeroplastigenens]|uniref:DUF368 domain-containing protein n=1 Tax=Alkalispirochaeta sphaeroplastigenens TaxID=1187066 RepID=A0A2S4JHT2_9SPIO|nr:DUF368 domain-containing protein [Alkalispirochaeta sphaeroplastigenens]POQ99118.1 hypothetical protein AU468_10920 [Alkalispirochaeta sphaeroplastigenens]
MIYEKKPLSPVNFLKGLAIGMANIIPGVSGGTIAVITGIYDELIDAFGNFFGRPPGWRRNLLFLVPVVGGILAGSVLFARLLGLLLDSAPGPTTFGFIGLILGSAPAMVRRAGVSSLRPLSGLLFCAGLAVVLWMGLAPRPEAAEAVTAIDPATAAILFGAAFVASIAMLIPGVSGSFLLLLMGMYGTLREGFSSLNIPVILIFALGTGTGVVLVSKLIAALLAKFHEETYWVIIGLVLGSAVALFPGLGSGFMILADLGGFLIGVAASLLLGTDAREWVVKRRENR